MDSEPISFLLTLSEWEELERIIEAVASWPNLEVELSISDSDYEDYPDSQASTVVLTMLDATTLNELHVNLDSHPEFTRDAMNQVHWATPSRFHDTSRICNSPVVLMEELGLLSGRTSTDGFLVGVNFINIIVHNQNFMHCGICISLSSLFEIKKLKF
jgi:hypothetical protein